MDKTKIYTKQYYENLALNILKKYYPVKFSKCEKCECPDWLCESVGLEVTRAISTSSGELWSFVKKCDGKEFKDINKEMLRKLGFANELTKCTEDYLYETRSLHNGSLTFLLTKDGRYLFLYYTSKMALVNVCLKDIKGAMMEKLEKLNNNYMHAKENDLAIIIEEQLNYIDAEQIIVDDVITSILNDIKTVYSKRYSIVFDTVYVIFFDNVFAIRTNDLHYERIKMLNQDFLSFSKISMA